MTLKSLPKRRLFTKCRPPDKHLSIASRQTLVASYQAIALGQFNQVDQ